MAVTMEALKISFLQRVELFRSRPFKILLPTSCMGGRKPSARIESSVRSNDAAIVNGQSIPRIQQLYHACESAFKRGDTASEESLATIRSILDEFSASDAGLCDPATVAAVAKQSTPSPLDANGWLPLRKSSASPPITYLEIYDCEDFSMGIFCLPPSAAIPLHNHPHMTVFSKLLYGSMHVRSLDWMESMEDAFRGPEPVCGTAVVVTDSVVSAPCATRVLFPAHGGNIHSFSAITHTAVLDVLAPPYNPTLGRHCNYFRFSPSPHLSPPGAGRKEGLEVGELVRLEEFEEGGELTEFVTQHGAYEGPKVLAD